MVIQFTWTCIFEFRHRLMYSRLRFVYQSAAKNRLRLDEKMMFCKFQSLGSSIINNDAKLAWIFQRCLSDTYMSTYWCLTHMVQWGKLIVEKDQASKGLKKHSLYFFDNFSWNYKSLYISRVIRRPNKILKTWTPFPVTRSCMAFYFWIMKKHARKCSKLGIFDIILHF